MKRVKATDCSVSRRILFDGSGTRRVAFDWHGECILRMAEIRVSSESPYADHLLSETDFRSRGVIIVAIRRPDGEVLLPPPGSTTIRADDVLIALGKVAAVSELLASECEGASRRETQPQR